MSKIQSDAQNFVSSAPRTLHSGQGKLLAILASHDQSASQQVILYDGTNSFSPVLLSLHIPANCPPVHLVFSQAEPLRFWQGLTVDPGLCELHLTTSGGDS
jgi:hypothetical protein